MNNPTTTTTTNQTLTSLILEKINVLDIEPILTEILIEDLVMNLSSIIKFFVTEQKTIYVCYQYDKDIGTPVLKFWNKTHAKSLLKNVVLAYRNKKAINVFDLMEEHSSVFRHHIIVPEWDTALSPIGSLPSVSIKLLDHNDLILEPTNQSQIKSHPQPINSITNTHSSSNQVNQSIPDT
jgi:hypothetical protein